MNILIWIELGIVFQSCWSQSDNEPTDKEVIAALEWSENTIDRLTRLEMNLPESMSNYSLLLYRSELRSAARRGYLLSKASRYLNDKICIRNKRRPDWCHDKTNIWPRIPTCNDASPLNDSKFDERAAAGTPFARILDHRYFDGLWETGIKLPDADEVAKGLIASIKPTAPPTPALITWTGLVARDMAAIAPYVMLNTGKGIKCCGQDNRQFAPRYVHPLCQTVSHEYGACIDYVRSAVAPSCSTGPSQQMNVGTHYLDGSSIYGSTEREITSRRTYVSGTIFPPQMLNCSDIEEGCEGIMEILLARYHNYIAVRLAVKNPAWNDDDLYHETRKLIVATIQHITYKHWLPSLVGEKVMNISGLLEPIGEVNRRETPAVYNSFAAGPMEYLVRVMGYRVREQFIEEHANEGGDLFQRLLLLLTRASHFYREGSTRVRDVALMIQRGRDHGLASYSDFRKYFNMSHSSFQDVSNHLSKPVITKLSKLFRNRIQDLDLAAGAMGESGGVTLGNLFSRIVAHQMAKTRNTDLNFYTRSLTANQLKEINKQTLARIICHHLDENSSSVPADVFRQISKAINPKIRCSHIQTLPQIDLAKWLEK